jgi:hypothetical protein
MKPGGREKAWEGCGWRERVDGNEGWLAMRGGGSGGGGLGWVMMTTMTMTMTMTTTTTTMMMMWDGMGGMG